jgi:hypothetical protein
MAEPDIDVASIAERASHAITSGGTRALHVTDTAYRPRSTRAASRRHRA